MTHLGQEPVYHAQVMVPLVSAVKYYSTVRAVTGAGNTLESSSNGITVDMTPPDAQFTHVGPEGIKKIREVVYQDDSDSIDAKWNATDDVAQSVSVSISLIHSPGIVIAVKFMLLQM